ncbi:serine hydrolase domain-containing protein [Tepidicaulis sp. LMO-SS28]|uniref:serine hydrolase domain-containing protein n=1 Tax=Tepidicaulis sp. LMO-SS28 TaxID=3447455 RepID=UPI003EE26130
MTLAGSFTVPEELGLSSERLARIPNFFKAYVDRQKFFGFSTLVARQGQIAHFETVGLRDRENETPVERDTIFRIYSMTKPITSLALMMLHEEGKFQLTHEVARYIPAFDRLQVFDEGDRQSFTTKPCARAMTIRDLLTHTSGLTYGFMYAHPVDHLYRKAGLNGAGTDGMTLEEMVEKIADIPLLFSPGERWNYSMSTDVCGRLVEVLSGKPLDQFFRERIFEPLGMHDTGFTVPEDKLARFAANYERDQKTKEIRLADTADAKSTYARPQTFFSGGGGLVSTATDYLRFCQMMLNGGELEGVRLISPVTAEFMTLNHLPGGKTMREMDNSAFSETGMDGAGFGLGFSVILDTAEAGLPVSPGAYSWGGLASTYFWIDPQEELIGIFMTQLMPSRSYPLRPQFQQLVYAAITE